jgi:hypothetical protein
MFSTGSNKIIFIDNLLICGEGFLFSIGQKNIFKKQKRNNQILINKLSNYSFHPTNQPHQ